MTIVFLAALITVNVALRALPVRRRGDAALSVVQCAFLRGGTRGAVLAVLATLHVRGDDEPEDPFDRAVLEAGDPPTGTWGIAASRPVRRAALALREGLVGDGLLAPTGHWAIARCALLAVPLVAGLAVVDQQLDLDTVLGSAVALVAAAGLWLAPRRTVAGWLALRAERRRYEQVTLAEQGPLADATAVGMLVALYGGPALEVLTRPAPADPVPSEQAPPEPAAATEEKSASPLTPRRLML